MTDPSVSRGRQYEHDTIEAGPGEWLSLATVAEAGAVGHMLHAILNPPGAPGPPYMHTLTDTPSITCPVCGMTSYNETDIEQGFCGNCHDWTTPR